MAYRATSHHTEQYSKILKNNMTHVQTLNDDEPHIRIQGANFQPVHVDVSPLFVPMKQHGAHLPPPTSTTLSAEQQARIAANKQAALEKIAQKRRELELQHAQSQSSAYDQFGNAMMGIDQRSISSSVSTHQAFRPPRQTDAPPPQNYHQAHQQSHVAPPRLHQPYPPPPPLHNHCLPQQHFHAPPPSVQPMPIQRPAAAMAAPHFVGQQAPVGSHSVFARVAMTAASRRHSLGEGLSPLAAAARTPAGALRRPGGESRSPFLPPAQPSPAHANLPESRQNLDEDCPICATQSLAAALDDPAQGLGSLDCCDHLFCHGCVSRWVTDFSNTCPQCRAEATKLVCRRRDPVSRAIAADETTLEAQEAVRTNLRTARADARAAALAGTSAAALAGTSAAARAGILCICILCFRWARVVFAALRRGRATSTQKSPSTLSPCLPHASLMAPSWLACSAGG